MIGMLMEWKYFFSRAMHIGTAGRRVAAGLVCIAFAAACGKSEAPAQPAEGRLFPALALDDTAGNALAAPALQGKMLVLNVWATWCPPCRHEMPGLERLSRSLDPKRFAVIGMSTDRDELLASEFLLQNGITFTNFFDRNGRMARQLGLKVYPETFVIAPDGVLMQRITGLREWDSAEMHAQLEAAYRRHQDKTGRNDHVK
jgi:thiol-disulfide isomerase/thioredoxin